MQVVTSSPDKLVVRNRSVMMGVVLAIGAVLWVVTTISVAVWGAVNLSTQTPLPTFYWLRIVGLFVVFVMGCFFAVVGVLTSVNLLRGVTCAFDRQTETITVTGTQGIRVTRQQYSIYGVSHVQAVENDHLRSIALYLVLRSGQRISLGTCSPLDKPQAEQLVGRVRAFLQQRRPG